MISIITPVLNSEKYIESCINSVVDQNCSSIEHIIIDGCSTDNTIDIIREYSTNYSHITFISEKDNGQSDALNKGIKMASNKLLGILNADDYYQSNVLNRIVDIFKNIPEPSFIYGNCNVWEENAKLKYINKPGNLTLKGLLSGMQIHPVNPSAYFYHKSIHSIIGDYKVDEHYAMDLDFLLRAIQISKFIYFDEIWGNWRRFEGTKTVNDSDVGRMYKRKEQLLKEYKKELNLLDKIEVTLSYPIYKYKRLIHIPITLTKNIIKRTFHLLNKFII